MNTDKHGSERIRRTCPAFPHLPNVALFSSHPCVPRRNVSAKAGPPMPFCHSLVASLHLCLSVSIRPCRAALRVCSLTLLLSVLLLSSSTSTVFADTLRTVDGREVAGTLVALNRTNAVMQSQAGRENVSAADIAAIRFRPAVDDLMAGKNCSILLAADGSAVAVHNVTVSNGQLRAASDSFGNLAIPMESITCLLRPNQTETPQDLLREKERMNLKPRRNDILVVRVQTGKYIVVDAVVDRMDTQQVVVIYDRAENAMPAETVAIVIPAAPDKLPEQGKPLGQIVGADGSRLFVSAAEATSDRVAVVSPLFGNMTLAKAALAELKFQGEQVQYLSDLQPREVKETPYFDDTFPWRKDRSVSGAPLQLDGKTYEKGLGLHADCRMTFDLGGKFRHFTALAGIDDNVQSGQAVLTILADGKAVADRIALARDRPPVKIDFDIRDVRELAIHVGFVGATAGSGARVNLCESLLLK